MPPKTSSGASKKTETKKKERVVEDKTFGLKNKKGTKQQKFIQQVQKQVHSGGTPAARKADLLKETEKLNKKKGDDPLLTEIFKPVQKVEKGADPKSILCAFFKQGTCGKGDKCKFSHDLSIERKAEKRSLYCDMRDDGTIDKEKDTMENWDEEKLMQVVNSKHNNDSVDDAPKTTDIICKFFIDAVEKNKYGWFWECPNGGSCRYRHALPPGFVLKKDKKKEKELEDENKISLEDWIETERNKLARSGKELTKVNLETFVAWKKRKISEKKEATRKTEEKKLRDFKAGNKIGLSGREMFNFNPELAADENDEEDGEATFDFNSNMENNDEEVDENEYKEIELDDYESMYQNEAEELVGAVANVEIDEDLFDDDEFD